MNIKLNPEQKRAVETDNKNTLVLAGAGSGKTRVIIERVSYLITEKDVDPTRVLVITFTNKAAKELKDRLREKNRDDLLKIRTGTFHGFCLEQMKSHPQFFEQVAKTTVIVDSDIQHFITSIRKRENLDKNFYTNKLFGYYMGLESHNKGEFEQTLKRLEEQKKYSLEHKTTQKLIDPDKIRFVLDEFKKFKKEHKYITFDDILNLFEEGLLKDKATKDYFKALFDHILVDEMQDTNSVQWKILEQMSDPAFLYCVGDDAQSIYAFRGAEIKNIQNFKSRVDNAETFKLLLNYRSNNKILDLANWVLKNSAIRYEKDLVPQKFSEEKPLLKDFILSTDEAHWVGKKILDLITTHKVEPKDILVLSRSSAIFRELELSFREKGIQYYVSGGRELLEYQHVKNFLSFLRCIHSTKDYLAWIRFLQMLPKVGAKTAFSFATEVKTKDSFFDLEALIKEKIAKDFATEKFFSDLYALLREFEAKKMIFGDHLKQLFFLVEPILSAVSDEETISWGNRKKHLDFLVNFAVNASNLNQYLSMFLLDSKDSKSGNELVHISTIHSAKGLEAKVCFIVQCQEGSFPSSLSSGEKEIEEERRILYVALTRAKDNLFLTRSEDNSRKTETYFFDGIEKTGLIQHEPLDLN